MLLIIRKAIFLVGLTLYIISAHSQTVTSTGNGVWNDPAIWSTGFVPTSANATGIVIDHEVELPAMFAVSVYYLIVNGKLTLKGSSQLSILADGQSLIPDLAIVGILVCEEGAVLSGTSTTNTTFGSGSVYIHQQGPLGFIPYATWDESSTFVINGFKDSGYINIAHSDSWKQMFGNVIYDCPQQTIFVVDLNGYLRNIRGDFTVKNTNSKTLRLSTTQGPTINVGGNLIVQGPSEVWFSTNGTSTTVNIQKDFNYASTSTGPSYLTTRGMTSLNVLGNFEWNSAGPLRMASSSSDSLGMRRSVVNISGNLSIINGVMIAPPAGSGSGRIEFKGTGLQRVTVSSTGASFQGNLDYNVDPGSIVDLGNSALSNTTGSLQVFGTLRVGSPDPLGAIQLTNKGNIHISGLRRYEPGSTIEYNGSLPQWLGNGHPSNASVNLVVSNSTSTTLLQDVLCRDIGVSGGTLYGAGHQITIYGNAVSDGIANIDLETMRIEGDADQSIATQNQTLHNVSVNKSGGTVSITAPLKLSGMLQIESSNTTFRSDGNLTLLSTSDAGNGTARVGAIPAGSSIAGDVIVQRYMSAEGRIFRYISMPVQEASVASLMDDFAVTGKFADPTANSTSPSLYYYDESRGSLQGGWQPYPIAGLASDNLLQPGVGYCALIRASGLPVVWDVTGTLNQGEVNLPVAMTPDMAPSNGWNLVGNPYPCTIDWDIDGANGWTKENISPVFCIRDNGIGSWGSVKYWDGDINYSDIPGGQIAAGQSFWVKATGPDPKLIAREGIKVTNDASFFRDPEQYIPSFVLVLKKDARLDKAYYKVRQGAAPTFDEWDAIKMDNDNFDISTLSDDGLSLAINSRDSLPCGVKHVKVKLKDLRRGIYKLELDTRYDFGAYRYTWIDRYMEDETSLRQGEEIDIEITNDPASNSPDRFSLRLEEIPPADSLIVVSPSSVCSGGPVSLIIRNAQLGIFYSVWENGRYITSERMGMGEDLIVEVSSDSIDAGTHRLEIVGRSACRRTTLVSKPTIHYEKIELSVPQYSICEGKSATLSVTSNVNVNNYFWFASATSTDTLATGASFTTPPLLKSQHYYVSATLGSGCHSDRRQVYVRVVNARPALITLKDSVTLCSNYTSNVQWQLNGVLISNESELAADDNGSYVLIVDTLGCFLSDTVEFINASTKSFSVADITVFPNPVQDYLNLSGLDDVTELDIIGSSGNVCRNLEGLAEFTVDVRELKSGTYFAVVRLGQRKRIIRFVKVD